MAVPFGVMMGAARLSGAATGESVAKNFARFGYAVIPLDLAGHVAHNLFHLLSEGKAVFFNAAALVDYHVTGSAELVSPGTVTMLQFVIVGLGIAGSVYTATRIAQRSGSAAVLRSRCCSHTGSSWSSSGSSTFTSSRYRWCTACSSEERPRRG